MINYTKGFLEGLQKYHIQTFLHQRFSWYPLLGYVENQTEVGRWDIGR